MTCPLCNEPHDDDCVCFDICTTCHEKAYSYPRCNECGTVDIGWLHSRLTTFETRNLKDGWMRVEEAA